MVKGRGMKGRGMKGRGTKGRGMKGRGMKGRGMKGRGMVKGRGTLQGGDLVAVRGWSWAHVVVFMHVVVA